MILLEQLPLSGRTETRLQKDEENEYCGRRDSMCTLCLQEMGHEEGGKLKVRVEGELLFKMRQFILFIDHRKIVNK